MYNFNPKVLFINFKITRISPMKIRFLLQSRLFIISRIIFGIVFFLFQQNTIKSQCNTRFIKDNGSNLTQYGQSVDVDGDRIAVGSDNVVYIYDWNETQWIERIIAPSDGVIEGFGYSVSLDGDRCIIGAYLDNSIGIHSGSAYIYEFDGISWNETKLIPSDGNEGHEFGCSVDLKGDKAIVGAKRYYKNSSNEYIGAAYIYNWDGSNWNETKILASDGITGDYFGASVAIEGNLVLVGANENDDNGSESGLVYAFEWNGSNWIESKLFASNGSEGDLFGSVISIDNNWAVVGAIGHNERKGAAYIFRYSGTRWSLVKELSASDGEEGDRFGASVNVSGNKIIVGATNAIRDGVFSAYTYEWDDVNWVESQLTINDSDLFSFYGRAVAVSENRAVIGARLKDNEDLIGAIYIFEEKMWFRDSDGDTFGNPENSMIACEQPDGYVSNSEDCNDTNPNINPEADEIPDNEVDEDCNGLAGTTSINKLNNPEISIYPNPAIDQINIINKTNSKLNFKLTNSIGNKIISGITESSIDISNLSPGIYILSLENSMLKIKVKQTIIIL